MDELAEKIMKVREMVEMLVARGRDLDLQAAGALRAKIDGALDRVVALALGESEDDGGGE